MQNRTITPDQVMTQLRGGTMTIEHIAGALWADVEAVKPIIAELLSTGRIRVSKQMAKQIGYQIVRTKKAPKERLTTSVATPPAAPVLKGEITGYTNEMRLRVELAMLGRGRQ